jgi:hypothetical protein
VPRAAPGLAAVKLYYGQPKETFGWHGSCIEKSAETFEKVLQAVLGSLIFLLVS